MKENGLNNCLEVFDQSISVSATLHFCFLTTLGGHLIVI